MITDNQPLSSLRHLLTNNQFFSIEMSEVNKSDIIVDKFGRTHQQERSRNSLDSVINKVLSQNSEDYEEIDTNHSKSKIGDIESVISSQLSNDQMSDEKKVENDSLLANVHSNSVGVLSRLNPKLFPLVNGFHNQNSSYSRSSRDNNIDKKETVSDNGDTNQINDDYEEHLDIYLDYSVYAD